MRKKLLSAVLIGVMASSLLTGADHLHSKVRQGQGQKRFRGRQKQQAMGRKPLKSVRSVL